MPVMVMGSLAVKEMGDYCDLIASDGDSYHILLAFIRGELVGGGIGWV